MDEALQFVACIIKLLRLSIERSVASPKHVPDLSCVIKLPERIGLPWTITIDINAYFFSYDMAGRPVKIDSLTNIIKRRLRF